MSSPLRNRPTRLAVAGAAGRMGRRLIALAAKDPAFELAAALEHTAHEYLGADSGELVGVGPNGVAVADHTGAEFDVLVDFSLPAGTMHWLEFCLPCERAFVTGVTGLTAEHLQAIESASRRIPVLQAPNMSPGVNLMLQLVRQAAGVLGEYDVEIIEAHHRYKRDAPSGTAHALRDAVAQGRDAHTTGVTYGRHGTDLERPDGQVGLHSLRGGDHVGQHEVLFYGPGETLAVRHQAQSRDTFARGALRAAAWIKNQPPGRYSMQDVLLRTEG